MKYNLNSRGFMMDGHIVQDDISTGGSFLNRQLLQTLPKVYELEYAPLWTLQGNLSIPIAGNLAGYTEKVEEMQYEAKGEVKEYVDATADIPTLKSAYGSVTYNVHQFTLASEYTLQELAAFEMQPQKLQKDLAHIDFKLRHAVHSLLCFGSAKRQSTGLFNDALVPLQTGGYDPAAGGVTYQQHLDFFGDIISTIEDSNEMTTRVGTIKIPNKLYSVLVRTRQTNDSGQSVMSALRQDYPEIRFERVNECRANLLERNGVQPVGTGLDRIVFCPVMDNSQMDRLADAPNVMPSQWKDMSYRTVFYMRSTQTMIHMPKSFYYFDIPAFS